MRRFFETVFDFVEVGIWKVKVDCRNVAVDNKLPDFIGKVRFPRIGFAQNKGVFSQCPVAEFQRRDTAFVISYLSFHIFSCNYFFY